MYRSWTVMYVNPYRARLRTRCSAISATTHTMRAVYLEVDRPHRLVWIEGDVEGDMTTTITFTRLDDDRTEVVTHQTNVPPALLAPQARAGFQTSLDRFEVYLAALNAR